MTRAMIKRDYFAEYVVSGPDDEEEKAPTGLGAPDIEIVVSPTQLKSIIDGVRMIVRSYFVCTD